MENLSGKNVVVIGVTGGIGGALATKAIDAGAAVYGVGRQLTCDVTGLAGYFSADLMVSEERQKVLSELPKQIDYVVIATGFLHDSVTAPEKRLSSLTPEALIQNYTVNAMLPMLFARDILPKLAREKAGVLAVLSARVGSISDNQLGGWYSYRMSKAALNMGLKTLSIEAARTHKDWVVLGLHPGTVETGLSAPFQGNVAAGKLFTPQQSAAYLWDVIAARTPADSGKVFDWQGEEISP